MARPDRGRPAPQRACWGESNPAAKLTEDAVIWIRAAGESCRYLAAQFNVAPGTISAIKRGDAWRHLLEDRTPSPLGVGAGGSEPRNSRWGMYDMPGRSRYAEQ